MPGDKKKAAAIELEIRRYCAAHPRAADTVEGVARFWLGGLLCSIEEVERALSRLVARGELSQRRLADGRVLYARRKDG